MSTLVSLLFLLPRRKVTFYSLDRDEKSIARGKVFARLWTHTRHKNVDCWL